MKYLKLLSVVSVFLIAGCAPEIGSDQWCDDMKEKPKGDWTANELKDFTKYCVLNQKPE